MSQPDYRALARQRGTWAMARKLRKDGVPLHRALRLLLGVRPIPVLTDVVRRPQ